MRAILILVVALLCGPSSLARAQATNDLVQTWLRQSGKAAEASDYSTCQPDGQSDRICTWNVVKLGPQPTTQQLQTLVSVWQAQQAAAAQYATLLAIGSVQVNSAGSPLLNGAYGIALNDKLNVSSVIAGIAVGQGLPGSQSTFTYFDAAHQPHVFDATQFTNFAKALRDYVYSLALAAAGQGAIPATPVTIP